MTYQPLAERDAARRTRPPFVGHAERETHALSALACALLADQARLRPLSGPALDSALRPHMRRHPMPNGGFFSRAAVIDALRSLASSLPGDATRDALALAHHLRAKPTRSRSGVAPVTVLTKPFPCPGECVFCPNDVRMPKSYLSDEPGAQRAEDNGFHPYLQTYARLAALRALGHQVDKVELLILGGTWSFYPEAYQVWFVTRCFEALSDFGMGIDGREALQDERFELGTLPRAPGTALAPGTYNRMVRAHELTRTRDLSQARWSALESAHAVNTHARVRCVGLVIETRPDHVNPTEAIRLRRLGCTKVQLGLQSLRDDVLALNKRGHTHAQACAALACLRTFGFKVLVHWMPNLLGATAEQDKGDARALFDDHCLRPDELKVYPCALIETAELMRFYENGAWAPYHEATLCNILVTVMRHAPRYTRLSRIVRDIPSGDIVVGNRHGNLRENAEKIARDTGFLADNTAWDTALPEGSSRRRLLQDLRAREVTERYDGSSPHIFRKTFYRCDTSVEVFIEAVDAQDRVAGFARLRLPGDAPATATAASAAGLRDAALLRELHVYGTALALGSRDEGSPQHRGLGRKLAAAAALTSARQGYRALAVIAAVGTRSYYEKLGFSNDPLYPSLPLSNTANALAAAATCSGGREGGVEIGAAVAEEAEGRAVAAAGFEVEGM